MFLSTETSGRSFQVPDKGLSVQAAATPRQEPGRAQHILFVDDEALVAEVTSQILEDLDYRVTVRGDGLEALEYFRDRWPEVDLVILDMMMPRMGGKDAFLAMKRINPRLKALIVSGFSVQGEAQQLMDCGALGFLQKPFRRADLARLVAHALEAAG